MELRDDGTIEVKIVGGDHDGQASLIDGIEAYHQICRIERLIGATDVDSEGNPAKRPDEWADVAYWKKIADMFVSIGLPKCTPSMARALREEILRLHDDLKKNIDETLTSPGATE